jgi:hypothetical protein
MSESCSSCAFRPGCATYDKEAWNRLRSTISALSGRPFFCHKGLNWRKPMAVKNGIVVDTEGNSRRLKVCQGWKNEVVKHVRPGIEHRAERIRRRRYGSMAMEWLQLWLDEKNPHFKARLQRRLNVLMRLLRWRQR